MSIRIYIKTAQKTIRAIFGREVISGDDISHFTYKAKIRIRRIRINAGGYARDGRYFGIGGTPWEIRGGDIYSEEFRAEDKADALRIAKAAVPNALIW